MCFPSTPPAPPPVAPIAPLEPPKPMALADNMSGRRAGGISQLRIASQSVQAAAPSDLTIAGSKAPTL